MKAETLLDLVAFEVEAMEQILIRNNLCSREGAHALTVQIMNASFPDAARAIRDNLTAGVAAIELENVPFETMLQRLRAHGKASKLDLGDDK